jgi:transposase InsO family protein
MKMQQSMSRKGNRWDKAPTERFFRSLKHEQLTYETECDGGVAFDNGKRTHSNTAIKPRWNLSEHFIGKQPKEVSGFVDPYSCCWGLV